MVCVGIFIVACNGGVDRATAGKTAPTLRVEVPPALHILVIGGTSGIGLETVKLTLNRGHTVTAMAVSGTIASCSRCC